MINWIRHSFTHFIQAALAWSLNAFFAILPVDWASSLGGWMGRTIGPRLRVSNNARQSLARVFPGLKPVEIETVVLNMWDNLGRTAGEHPHLAKFDPYKENSRVEIIGTEHLDNAKEADVPALFFSAHLANWELVPLTGTKRGLNLHVVYRQANNPFFDRLIQKGRKALGGKLLPKGAAGSKDIIRTLKNGEHIAMLVDQKMNDGISVPFLGADAMTAPALAQLALKYNCQVIPVQAERLDGARFRVTVHPPLAISKTDDKADDVAKMMTTVNEILGGWIKHSPAQWLWVHNRWPNDQEKLLK